MSLSLGDLKNSSLKNEYSEILKSVEDALKEEVTTGPLKKTGFSASALFYGHGKCFSGKTEFVTNKGIKTLEECAGQSVVVWTGGSNGRSKNWQGHGWKPATVESFGVQEIYELVLTRSGVERVVETTETHRWLRVTDYDYQSKARRHSPKVAETHELNPGDIMWHGGHSTRSLPQISPDGVRHGFVFGDGNKPNHTTTAQFFGEKDDALVEKYFSGYTIKEGQSDLGNKLKFKRAYGLPGHYKSAPLPEYGTHYLYGFLAGYFAADGSISANGSAEISSAKMENINLVKDICEILRIGYGSVYTKAREGITGEILDIHKMSLSLWDLKEDFFLLDSHREVFISMTKGKSRMAARQWRVKEVRATGRYEEVFCVIEPETETFALADGLLTKNCPRRWSLVFRGVEDQYDPWAYYNRRAVRSGSAAHDHLQELFVEATPKVVTELEFWETLPRMHGFIDLYYPDENVIGEIKTVGNRAFEARKNSKEAADYHELQLLVYMYIKKAKFGFVFYENRDTFEYLIIPVHMTDARLANIKRIFAWMEEIQAAHDAGKLIKVYPKRRANSAMCNKCPIRKACDEAGEGDISIELQDKYIVPEASD